MASTLNPHSVTAAQVGALAPDGDGSGLSGITQSQVSGLTTDLAAKAPLASPTLTGTPTAPTATVGTNTTQIATTEFVLANATPGGGGSPGGTGTEIQYRADASSFGGFGAWDAATNTLSLATGSGANATIQSTSHATNGNLYINVYFYVC